MTVPDDRIRRMRAPDVAAVVGLVHELADYEQSAAQCELTEEQLRLALFGGSPALYGHVATVDDVVVGCALWFLNYSTWRGVHGIYLEDLYVAPAHRGSGLGRALLAALARECVANGYARLDWGVLNWNEPSIQFYRSLGARGQQEWTTMRLCDDALVTLAQR